MPLCKVNKYCSVFLLSLWTGFLASIPKPLGINNSLDITEDIELCPLYHIKSKKSVPLHDQIVGSPDVFVYGIQGKSRNVSLWPLHNLLASNANLREVDPNREAETGQYLIPQEGIQSVLCNKIVILRSWKYFWSYFGGFFYWLCWWALIITFFYLLHDSLILWTDAKLCNTMWQQNKNQCILTVWFLWVYICLYLLASPMPFNYEYFGKFYNIK